MNNWKYWLTMSGWKVNAWFNASVLARVPFLASIWFAGKRLTARWLASGRGVRVNLGGQSAYIHPFTIAYGIHNWEPYTAELFQNALKPGSTVLDIGAHHGYFSLLAARCVGKEGRVYAFEPVPQNFQILKTNIELNHLTNVTPVNKAVSDRCTTVPFFYRRDTGVGGSLFPTNRPNECTVPVESITIDAFLAGESVDVVKMDIEGGESFALEGMNKTLFQSKCLLLIVEFIPGLLQRAGVNPEEFLAQLDKAGFECQLINEELRCLQPLVPDVALSNEYSGETRNLYCTKKATAA